MSAAPVAGDAPDASTRPQLDSFVFRRVADGRYAHLGGDGRGEGWAGIVRVDLAEERAIAHAIAEQEVVVHRSAAPSRLFGPYWANEGVVVPLGHDELVVLGGPGSTGLAPAQVVTRAREVADRVCEVGPAKRLADELEMLHAVKAVALTPLTHLDVVAEQVLVQVAGALSCEIAVLHLPVSGIVVVHDEAAPQPLSTEDAAALAAAMAPGSGTGQRCFQELSGDDRAGLPPSTEQVVSLLAVPMDVEPGALLLLAHTTGGPRGFTDLCRSIATNVAEAARTVLLAGMQHDQLVQRAEDAASRAMTDGLTGLLNRRGWEDALAAVPPSTTGVSIILADGNGLKRTNDEEGHSVGDARLVAWAQALRQHVRHHDPLARIGGDEFGVLLVGADEDRCADLLAAVRGTLAASSLGDSLAMGHATGTGAEIAGIVRRADVAMYRDKGEHRRR